MKFVMETGETMLQEHVDFVGADIPEEKEIFMEQGKHRKKEERTRKKTKRWEEFEKSSQDKQKKTRSENLYCICQKPDDREKMIECEECHDWFHIQCVGISEKETDYINYSCLKCMGNFLNVTLTENSNIIVESESETEEENEEIILEEKINDLSEIIEKKETIISQQGDKIEQMKND